MLGSRSGYLPNRTASCDDNVVGLDWFIPCGRLSTLALFQNLWGTVSVSKMGHVVC